MLFRKVFLALTFPLTHTVLGTAHHLSWLGPSRSRLALPFPQRSYSPCLSSIFLRHKKVYTFTMYTRQLVCNSAKSAFVGYCNTSSKLAPEISLLGSVMQNEFHTFHYRDLERLECNTFLTWSYNKVIEVIFAKAAIYWSKNITFCFKHDEIWFKTVTLTLYRYDKISD